jgi:hypothetical protein
MENDEQIKIRIMKTFLKIALVIILVMFVSPELMAKIQPADPNNAVGVPLDGGLLAILAGAGIAYFSARKKKKNN